jgi:hypothetical protein
MWEKMENNHKQRRKPRKKKSLTHHQPGRWKTENKNFYFMGALVLNGLVIGIDSNRDNPSPDIYCFRMSGFGFQQLSNGIPVLVLLNFSKEHDMFHAIFLF